VLLLLTTLLVATQTQAFFLPSLAPLPKTLKAKATVVQVSLQGDSECVSACVLCVFFHGGSQHHAPLFSSTIFSALPHIGGIVGVFHHHILTPPHTHTRIIINNTVMPSQLLLPWSGAYPHDGSHPGGAP
jgi:hypothetical protein